MATPPQREAFGFARTARAALVALALLTLVVPSVAALSTGCRSRSAAPAAGSASAIAVTRLPPLERPGWLATLDVPGFSAARVSVPLGARSARPVLVALHGGRDRPEWQCGSYRHVQAASGFVLCPAGAAGLEGAPAGLGTIEESARELRAALPALKASFAPYVEPGPVVLAALGAAVDLAIEIALEEPRFFSRLVLVGGSLARLTAGVATRFGEAGGQRVLVACEPATCDDNVERRLRALESVGVETRLVRLERGRGLDDRVVARLAREWSWLRAGDARWR